MHRCSAGSPAAGLVRNIQEAIAGYLDSLKARDEPIPPSIDEEVASALPRNDPPLPVRMDPPAAVRVYHAHPNR